MPAERSSHAAGIVPIGLELLSQNKDNPVLWTPRALSNLASRASFRKVLGYSQLSEEMVDDEK